MENKMTTNEILQNIEENGGFNNSNNWNKKEVKQWVLSNYIFSSYVDRTSVVKGKSVTISLVWC